MEYNFRVSREARTRDQLARYAQHLWQRPRDLTSIAVFWLLLLGMVALRASDAMYAMHLYSHDAFMVLDGAWRMLNGQRPHVDFNSMIGPAAYLPTLIGFKLASNTAAGFAYGQALMGLVGGIWAYLVGAKLNEVPRVLYALCVAAVAISPAELGLGPLATTPAMTYNRFGYAILGVLLLECLGTETGSELMGGFSSGAALGLLAFGKISAFAGGMALVLALLTQRKQTGRRWAGIAAGAALVSLSFLAYLHFDVAAVVRDLAMTVLSKRVKWDDYILNSIATEIFVVALLVYPAYWVFMESGKPQAARRLIVATVSVILISLLLVTTNYQQAELPLAGMFLLVVGQRLLTGDDAPPARGGGWSSLIAAGCGVIAGLTVFFAIGSLAGTEWMARHSARVAQRFQAPALRQFVPTREDSYYTLYVNDGLKLLKRERRPGETVMSLDFTNPFSYGLWIPPAPGGSTNLQYDGSFSDRHYVSPEKLFGAADLVMMPKSFSDGSLADSIPGLYGPFLDSHFQLVAESDNWKLYRNRAEKA